MLFYNGSKVEQLKCEGEWGGGHYGCVMVDEGVLYAWGMGDGYGKMIENDTQVPVMVMDGVGMVEMKNVYNSIVTNGSGFVFTKGQNNKAGLGYYTVDEEERCEYYKVINMTAFDSDSEIRSIHSGRKRNFVLYENNDLYAWGMEDSGYVYLAGTDFQISKRRFVHPFKMNLLVEGSEIPLRENNTKILQFHCHTSGCFVLARNNDTNTVYSWGTTQDSIGRYNKDGTAYIPKRIDRRNFIEDDEVVQISVTFTEAIYITQTGRVYFHGCCSWISREHDFHYNNLIFQWPTRILLDYDNIILGSLSTYYEHFVFLGSGYRCASLLPRDPLVCNGVGRCVGENRCECDDDDYYGNNCELIKCNGILSNNSDAVCSGNGNCTDFDVCTCDYKEDDLPLYSGKYCSIHYCDGILFNVSGVCNGNGNCTDGDTCECIDDFYGQSCETYITNARYMNYEGTLIYVTFVVEGSYITSEEMKTSSFGCNVVIKNDEEVGSDMICEFSYNKKKEETVNLKIQFLGERKIKAGEYLYVRSLSKTDDYAELKLKAYEKSFLETYQVYFFGIALILILIMIIIIFILIIMMMVKKQRERIKKLDEIVDIDLLLEESKAEKIGNINFRINDNLFEVDPKEIELISEIGRGGSGTTLYKAKWKEKIIAYKLFKIFDVFHTNPEFSEFEKELEIISVIKHKHLVNFYGASMKQPRIGLLMEFIEGGSLNERIQMSNDKMNVFDIKDRVRILYEIALGMQFLHAKGLIHRDIKGENVLLTQCLSAKIIDFGLCKMRRSDMTKHIGTADFMAPEVVLSHSYDNTVDLFSYSILIYVVFSENLLPYGMGFGNEFKVAKDPTFRPSFTQEIFNGYEWITEIMKKCWDHDPSKRIPFDSIISIFEEHLEDDLDNINVRSANDDESVENIKEKFNELESIIKNDSESINTKYEKLKNLFNL